MSARVAFALVTIALAGCTASPPPNEAAVAPLLREVALDSQRAVLETNGTAVLALVDLNEAAWDDGAASFFGFVVGARANVSTSLVIATWSPGRPGHQVQYNFQEFPPGSSGATTRFLDYEIDADQPRLAVGFAAHGGPAELSIGLVPISGDTQFPEEARHVLALPEVRIRPDSSGHELHAGSAWRLNVEGVQAVDYVAGALQVTEGSQEPAGGLATGTTRYHGTMQADLGGILALEFYVVQRPQFGTFSIQSSFPDGTIEGHGVMSSGPVGYGDIPGAVALGTAGVTQNRCSALAKVSGPGDLQLAAEHTSVVEGQQSGPDPTGAPLPQVRIVTWGFFSVDLSGLGWPVATYNDCTSAV